MDIVGMCLCGVGQRMHFLDLCKVVVLPLLNA